MNDYFLRNLSREIVFPSRTSSIPSCISLNSSESDIISSVSFMLSYLSFGIVIVSAMLKGYLGTAYLKLSVKQK